jgi:transglutaminase-like putative cysteine protease
MGLPLPRPVHSLQRIPSGDAGIRATLREMRSIVRTWKTDPDIRTAALEIIEPCAQRDWVCEIEAVQQWVKHNVKFVADVSEVETLQTPELTLYNKVGDCDDQSILVGALLNAIGHPVRFIAVDMGNGFEHVFTETAIGSRWVAVETTEDWELGRQPIGVRRRMVQRV